MSEEQNMYKFDESSPEVSSSTTGSGLDVPISQLKDIGGIPLPKNEDMSKWFVVIAVIVVLGALWFVGSWVNFEMKFKNDQIKACHENFQNLNVKYVLKDQELQQYKNQNNQQSSQQQQQQQQQQQYQPENVPINQ